MKRIEDIENDFIMHFREMLKNSFPSPLKYRVDCYLGEDKRGVRGLNFILDSKQFGQVYTRHEYVPSGLPVKEFEFEFMNRVINDLVLAGVSFLNVEAYENRANDRIEKEIKAYPFKTRLPQKMLFIN